MALEAVLGGKKMFLFGRVAQLKHFSASRVRYGAATRILCRPLALTERLTQLAVRKETPNWPAVNV